MYPWRGHPISQSNPCPIRDRVGRESRKGSHSGRTSHSMGAVVSRREGATVWRASQPYIRGDEYDWEIQSALSQTLTLNCLTLSYLLLPLISAATVFLLGGSRGDRS